MARVNVTVGSTIYPIACDDSQEARVHEVVTYLNSRLAEVKRVAPTSSSVHQLIIVSLLIADELLDLQHSPAKDRTATLGNDPGSL
jgi:cell division protein ZapA